jgi:hypothetical protein
MLYNLGSSTLMTQVLVGQVFFTTLLNMGKFAVFWEWEKLVGTILEAGSLGKAVQDQEGELMPGRIPGRLGSRRRGGS